MGVCDFVASLAVGTLNKAHTARSSRRGLKEVLPVELDNSGVPPERLKDGRQFTTVFTVEYSACLSRQTQEPTGPRTLDVIE